MIHAICGKTGGGKSYLALNLIINELRTYKDSCILTNLSVVPGELADYLHNKYGETFDLSQRLRLLTDETSGVFWEHRKDGVRNFILIDEFHMFYSARRWMKTGEAALAYFSQHRKFGDEVFWISQHPDQVEKQARNLTSDWTFVRNGMNEKMMQWFRPPACMWYSVFLSNNAKKPVETHMLRLDLKLAACYKTEQGVGVLTRTPDADKKQVRKGVPFLGLVAVIFGLVVLAGIAFLKAPALGELLWKKPVLSKPQPAQSQSLPPAQNRQHQSVSSPAPSHGAEAEEIRPPVVVGVITLGDTATVYFSNGNSARSSLFSADHQSVYVDGQWFALPKK